MRRLRPDEDDPGSVLADRLHLGMPFQDLKHHRVRQFNFAHESPPPALALSQPDPDARGRDAILIDNEQKVIPGGVASPGPPLGIPRLGADAPSPPPRRTTPA